MKIKNYIIAAVSASYTCIVIYSFNTNSIEDGLKIFSLGVLLSIAALATGGIFGFIFGIPSTKNNLEQHHYERNTSLKEVSDWLTKIIIGVSLVELKSIIKYFKILVYETSSIIKIDSSTTVFVAAIIIAFVITGFLLAYILTVTKFFAELANNDNLIRSIIEDAKINPAEVIISNSIKKDFNFNPKEKSQILEYVSKNGATIEDAYIAKRLAKILFHMKEYEHSSLAYGRAFDLDSSDINLKINEAFIRNKFLKQFTESNKILKEIILKNPELPNPYYNLACNYNREYKEVQNENDYKEYKTELKTNSKNNLANAFRKDKGLLSEALQDPELTGVEIQEIFDEIYPQN